MASSFNAGYGAYDPQAHFVSTAHKEVTGTTLARGYARARPKPGFDRQTANRTNYDLGGGEPTRYSTANAEQFTHPRARPVKPVPRFSNKQPLEAREIIARGGGGGAGNRGVAFNIITGAPRAEPRPPRTLRASYDVQARRDRARESAQRQYDCFKGRETPRRRAPPESAAAERAPKLGSLGALRGSDD